MTIFVLIGLSSYRQDAVSLAQLPTEISWTSSKNKGDEDSFSILSSNYVETETRGPPLEHHPPGFPGGKHKLNTHTNSVRVKDDDIQSFSDEINMLL